ncbi:hypothetical protein Q3G72_031825 [Acer saccharum]|nr:hypothetical protein Q3G72_031825 [Acer saccharum]
MFSGDGKRMRRGKSMLSGCERVELAVPANEFDEDKDENIGCKGRDGCDFGVEAGGSKESKVNISREDDHHVNNNQIFSNYSFGEAEALTDEIEEESLVIGEVLRIKDIFLNSQDESDSVLFDSLRKVELMALTVDTLKV